MSPEARTIEFTNGHAHFYEKKKVDSMNSFCCKLDCIISEFKQKQNGLTLAL